MSMNLQEQFQKLGLGEKIILIAGPLLFIDGFLNWYSVSGQCIDLGAVGEICAEGGSASGWESPGSIWSVLAILLGLTMAGLVAAVRFGNMKLPEMPQGVTWGRIMLGMGGASALFVVAKFVNHSSNLDFGFFIGALLVAALAAGGFLTFQEEQKSGSAGSGGAAAGPAGGGGDTDAGGGPAGGGGAGPTGGGGTGPAGGGGSSPPGGGGGGPDAGPSR
ncbi:MAG: hypothetical protein J4O12_03475 [Chloroflexi bacterium]|nr:hypothetical protein [Chloroflexota bacterium]